MAAADIGLLLVKFIVFLYGVITYPIYAVIYLPCIRMGTHFRSRARPVSRTKDEVTYRSQGYPNIVKSQLLHNNVDTMEKVLNLMVKMFGTRKALGTRTILKEEQEVQPGSGKVFKKLVLGEYTWMRFCDWGEQAEHFGKGLRELGVKPRDRVCIFADTRAEWMVAGAGCFKNSIAIATIYTNLGDDGIIHGVNQTSVETVITSQELLPKLLAIKSELPMVKNIIYFEDQLKDPEANGRSDFNLYPYKEVLNKGRESSLNDPAPPTPKDIAIVMYTSGSTGVPKGVVLTHQNMVASIISIVTLFQKSYGVGIAKEEDSYAAFLPLAHVLEMLAEHVMLLSGVKIGYSSPNTLTDKSTMIKAGGKGDVTVLQPTAMAAVPLILDRIYKGILSNINSRGEFSKKLIYWCIDYKNQWHKRGFGTPIMNLIIFNKMKAMVGGKIRLMMSGGAPLNDDAHEFIRTCLSVHLMQGYGLTETCACAAISDHDDLRTGIVGPPLMGVDLKIRSVPDMGYTVQDPQGPRGEIIIGGANIAEGYFNMPEKTKEEFFTEDGKAFFMTGDIGHVLEDGSLKIIDRKKDLVKLQGGEYVSLGKVEAALKTNALVDNVCTVADPSKHSAVALVVPDDARLKALADSLGFHKDTDRKVLCSDAGVVKAVTSELVKHATKAKLQKFEIPRQYHLVAEMWTPEDGLVTAAFKLKRNPIQQKYQNVIDDMYNALENPGSVTVKMPPPAAEKKTSKIDLNGNKVSDKGLQQAEFVNGRNPNRIIPA